MPKISSRDGGRPAQRTVNPIIVTRRGKIARLESGLTPQEAQIEDLVFLRKVLNRADIPYLLKPQEPAGACHQHRTTCRPRARSCGRMCNRTDVRQNY